MLQYEEDLAAGRAPDHNFLHDPEDLHFTLPGGSAHTAAAPAAAAAAPPQRQSARRSAAAVAALVAAELGTSPTLAPPQSGYQVSAGSAPTGVWFLWTEGCYDAAEAASERTFDIFYAAEHHPQMISGSLSWCRCC